MTKEYSAVSTRFHAAFLRDNLVDAWTEEMIASSISTGRFYGLCETDGEEIVSEIGYTRLDGEGELLFLATAVPFRRRGIAKRLLEKSFEDLKSLGVKTLFLEVRASNAGAKALYESVGFIKISERRNYYGKETADIYRKTIE